MTCSHPACTGKHSTRLPKHQLCPVALEKRRVTREAYSQRSRGRHTRYNATAAGWERARRYELKNQRETALARLAMLKEQEETCLTLLG